jgi:hypothetical protein
MEIIGRSSVMGLAAFLYIVFEQIKMACAGFVVKDSRHLPLSGAPRQ